MSYEGFREYIRSQHDGKLRSVDETIRNLLAYFNNIDNHTETTALNLAFAEAVYFQALLNTAIQETLLEKDIAEGIELGLMRATKVEVEDFILSYDITSDKQQTSFGLALRIFEIMNSGTDSRFQSLRIDDGSLGIGESYVILQYISTHPSIATQRQLRFTVKRENNEDFFGKVTKMEILLPTLPIRRPTKESLN